MKKRTLVAVLREECKLRRLEAGDLELVLGGIKTITQVDGKVVVIEGDTVQG